MVFALRTLLNGECPARSIEERRDQLSTRNNISAYPVKVQGVEKKLKSEKYQK